MRISAILPILVSLAAFGAPVAPPQPAPMHAGPLFTSGDANGAYPQYPELQIEVDIPPDAAPALRMPGSFRLTIDSGPAVQATKVQTLSSTNYGVVLVVSLDVSGSMKGAPLDAVRAGLAQFVSQAGPHDKMAVETIADDARWDTDFGDPPDKVRAALRGLSTRGSLTRLWDSLLIAINHLPATPLSRRLLIISDGHDEGSSHTLEQVIAAAQQHSLVVDAIGFTRSSPAYLGNLTRLGRLTGGNFRQARSTGDLTRFIGDGIKDAKETPVVTFRPDKPAADGATHRFQIAWLHQGVESRAAFSALLPAAPPIWRSRWVWVAAIVLAAGLLILLVILAGRPKKRPAPLPVAAATPVQNAAPAAGPQRAVTLNEAPSRPRVAETLRVADPPAGAPVRRAQRTEIQFSFSPPTPEHPIAWLACEEGFAPGRQFPVDQLEYWIGAAENNDLRIADDPTVSGNHACLVLDHEVLGIHDYQSTNGTRVNGELVTETRCLLRPGDRIRIGRSTFSLRAAANGASR